MQVKCDISEGIARKYPEQVVLVTTRSAEGRANVMAVGWATVVSGEPLMFALGIDDEAYTYELVQQTRQFVVAFPHAGMAQATLHAGSHHGRGRDKLSECGLQTQDGSMVRAPLLADAVANFECELVTIVKPGDCPVVIGQVVAAHMNGNPQLKRLYALASGHVLGGVTAEAAVQAP